MAANATARASTLPELAGVPWRRRVDGHALSRAGALWTLSAVAHTVPLIAAAVLLGVLNPITIPVGVVLVVHAWAIPELYASRGAKVVRPRPGGDGAAERRSLGLLGDLLGPGTRELQGRTGLVLERGRFGIWLVGEAGALLVRCGGRRVDCYCVRSTDAGLPSGDRIAHLLLALREDESGFATLANLAFSGARWRVRRRLAVEMRPALDLAAREAAGGSACGLGAHPR